MTNYLRSLPARVFALAAIFAVLCLCISPLSAAPIASNPIAEQVSDGAGSDYVRVRFFLSAPDGPVTTSLQYSIDDAPFQDCVTVTGDVGPGQTDDVPLKEIHWLARQDLDTTETTNLRLKVVVDDGLPYSVVLSNGPANGSTTGDSTVQIQIDIFEGTHDFTADDIIVTNANKGPLVHLFYPFWYTMELYPIGTGEVTVSVPAGVTTAANGSGAVNAAMASYSFFYDASGPLVVAANPTSYTLLNSFPPSLTVTLDEPLAGPVAGDLTVNGSPATSLGGTNPYTFDGFDIPSDGEVTVTLAGEDLHGNKMIHGTWTYQLDSVAPTLVNRLPEAAATVSSLTSITLLFSQEVEGLTAEKLSVNGSAATTLDGANPYTFSGYATPADGPVSVVLDTASVTDLAGNTVTGAGPWSYTLDNTLPAVIARSPEPVSPVMTALNSISVTLSEPVTGMTAGQLVVNGSAATAMSGSGAGPYLFSGFSVPATSPANVVLSSGAAIDMISNPLQPASWSYILNDGPPTVIATDWNRWGLIFNIYTQTAFILVFDEPVWAVPGMGANSIKANGQTPQMIQPNPNGGTVVAATYLGFSDPDGNVDIEVPAGAFKDAMGVPNPAYTATISFDTSPPRLNVASVSPASNALVVEPPTSVQCFFNRPVVGVTPDDLQVNWSAATSVTGSGAGPYVFSGFNPPGHGPVRVQFVGTITDVRGTVMPGGEGWSFSHADPVVPLNITSTVPFGASTRSKNQTFTFTFASPVSSFNLSNIDLTGATPVSFTAVDAKTFQLEVSALFGPVTVSVPANGAGVAFPLTGTQGASFTNYYIDTWDVPLPDGSVIEMIHVPAGSFVMGSPVTELGRDPNSLGEENQTAVQLASDFYISTREITVAQWKAIRALPRPQILGESAAASHPVHNVTAAEIGLWIADLNGQPDQDGIFALPTEAQWEYACRAGTSTRFSFGDGIAANETDATGGGRGDHMWFIGNSGGTLRNTDKAANLWGIVGMHGNAREYCSDFYQASYPGGFQVDPTGPGSGSATVVRGGSAKLAAPFARSAARAPMATGSHADDVGFRIVGRRRMPMSITSNRNQYSEFIGREITFSFPADVTGFDASDVQVVGATTGSFVTLNARTYKVPIFATPGSFFTVSVAANSCTPVSTDSVRWDVGVAKASYTGFCQRTRTLSLPLGVTMDFIEVPAGSVNMLGTVPPNAIALNSAFYVARTEVTQIQWTSIAGTLPGPQSATGFTHPVASVSWDDIQNYYLQGLRIHLGETNQSYTSINLPSELQWEYFCRAGTTTRFNFDGYDNPSPYHNMWWYKNASSAKPVAQLSPNLFGIYDTHGNVGEWCVDNYSTRPVFSFPGTENPPVTKRVVRGGGWSATSMTGVEFPFFSLATDPVANASHFRVGYEKNARMNWVGFRLVLIAP